MNRSSQVFLEYIENLIAVERSASCEVISQSSGIASIRIWLSDIRGSQQHHTRQPSTMKHHSPSSKRKAKVRVSLDWRQFIRKLLERLGKLFRMIKWKRKEEL